jgi:hypothetical protein
MVNTKVYVVSYKFYSFELSSIICEDPYGYAEPVYDTLQELDHCFFSDIYHCIASIHLVNALIVMNKNLNPPGALGKMPTMSILQIAKGLERSIG